MPTSKIELGEESQQLVVINAHTRRGLFHHNRLPFGIASAPAIFQWTMESILLGIKHVCVYIDDILVSGESESEHLDNLDQVLERLEAAGLQLK